MKIHQALLSSVGIATIMCGCAEEKGTIEYLDGRLAKQAVLPDNALDIDRYSRYYYQDSDGHVEAVFIVHSDNFTETVREACEQGGVKNYPCNERDYGIAQPGEYKLLDDRLDLPARNEGGCSYISIKYDPAGDRITSAKCNEDY